MIDKFFALSILKNAECRAEFEKMPSYYLENVLMLQNALFEKFDEKLFEEIFFLTRFFSYNCLHDMIDQHNKNKKRIF